MLAKYMRIHRIHSLDPLPHHRPRILVFPLAQTQEICHD